MKKMAARVEREDVVLPLCRNIVKVDYKDIPSEAISATKKSILDTLGVITGASGLTPVLTGLVDLVKDAGGKKESTILGFGGKVPAWMAAFVNGSMAHCLDYDDVHHEARVHPSAQIIPAGFAVAERLNDVEGKRFITAVTLGNDLMCRLGFSVETGLWQKNPVLGGFAAAAISGKLLELDEDRMVDALGHAFCQAAGARQMRLGVGSDIGIMRDGFPNKAGVLAALMAQSGITGVKESLEGRAGLYNAYFGGKYDRAALTNGLGEKFEGANIGYKPWPACGGTHVFIAATLELVNENNVQPRDIGGITVTTSDTEHERELCAPLHARQEPTTSNDAKYSIPFSVAVAAVKRKAVINDYTLEGIHDEEVLHVARKVTPKHDGRLNVSDRKNGREPGIVEIKMTDGSVFSKRLDVAYGHRERPLSWEDLVHKFRDCVSHSAKPVPKKNVEKVIDMVANLEEVDNVSRILRLLA